MKSCFSTLEERYRSVFAFRREILMYLDKSETFKFERRTLIGREVFPLFLCLDAKKFVLLSSFSLKKTDLPERLNQTTPQ